MDPCPFLRLIVQSLSLKLLPSPTKPLPLSGVHPSTTPCFCKIRISSLPSTTALLPLSSTSSTTSSPAFHFDSAALRRLSGKPLTLSVSVYNGPMSRNCGVRSAKLLGRVLLPIQLPISISSPITFHNGWFKLNHETDDKPSHLLHLLVRSEPDPRFVFHFGGEPECSPVIFQIQENIKQPVFSCKFSAKSQPLPSDFTNNNSSRWRRSLRGDREQSGQLGNERKGWMIVIHDLSGSPVAAASMITPFVPSPGSDRVSRSNAGAWVILRPIGGSTVSSCSWKPWGRLEAWRERGPIDGLGYKVELFSDNGPVNAIPIAEGTLSVKKGGKFCIDSAILGSKWLPGEGFVMGSTVSGEGKVSTPVVQVGARHVTCMPDAALFLALSAAIDLSMDACKLFSHKLRKELCPDQQYSFS
ncbi:hypothetical protein L195_g007663 [Trifolium pratense]|uniref:Uncharacterized protein n=1 Tax=Trifolium pratense TaxID=57577 RepID=A0A2K3P6Z8_TRIPR|nr:hypothetical protein L195_g007663 [Trifolium pratense]